MLRASIQHSGASATVAGIAEGALAGDAGIEHGALLTAFVDAVMRGEAAEQTAARDALREAAGDALVVDAAAVIGNFERMVRIADGTGIPLDPIVETISADLQEDLGVHEFAGRARSELGFSARVLGTLLRPFLSLGLRITGWRARRGA